MQGQARKQGKGQRLRLAQRGVLRFGTLIVIAILLGVTVVVSVAGQKPVSASPAVNAQSSLATGYNEVASDGGIFSFGSAPFHGSTGASPLNRPVVGMAMTPDSQGYWLVASDGGIFTFGDAQFYGSTGSERLNRPIVGMAATPDGKGYWLVGSDGGIFTFGDARFYGSTGSERLNQPIVGMAATPDGKGYWLVGSDGGIFSYGDAQFYGSAGSIHLNRPIVGMATTADGKGYWLVASDGGVFSYGDAQFYGSAGSIHLNQPIVGMAATADGGGYWMVASDGGIFSYGDAHFFGSTGAQRLNRPIVGMAATDVGSTGHTVSDATEVVYGSAGSFGNLATASALPDGQSVATEAVSGWGLLPGQSVMGAVLGPDGSIVMGDETQTGNQAQATANTMALSVFNPSTTSFQNIVIPTSTGVTSVTQPEYPTGGADISAIASIPSQGNRVAFMSAWPYRGWNATTLGQYPSFGYVAPSGSGSYTYVSGSGRTASSVDPSGTACPAVPTPYTPEVAQCRGPSALEPLPDSGDMVAAQYYDDVAAGQDSGALMVLNPQGQMVASYQYPNVSQNGSPVYAYPREITVDPTSTANHERFAVVFDIFRPNASGTLVQSTFTMQTFEFDAATETIQPQSEPFLPAQSVGGNMAYFENAEFDQHGNLWAAESVVGSISGGNIVEYSANSVENRLASGSCSAQASWASTQWGAGCSPDVTITAAAGKGDVYSVNDDTVTGAMYFTTLSGILIPVTQVNGSWQAGTMVDIGINSLVNRSFQGILPRQGALDSASGTLWIPIEQWESVAACDLPTGQNSCLASPSVLDQWLIRIDLNDLSS
jgi:hypothetical protein